MNLGLECVQPIEEHGKLVMKWRNDPKTLSMSFRKSPKEWESFEHEFLYNYFCFPEYPPLFALRDGQRVAFASLRPVLHPNQPHRRCCLVSINVAPEWREKGIGKAFLRKLTEFAEMRCIDDLLAEVTQKNTISHLLFKNIGFEKLADSSRNVDGEVVLFTSYLLRLNTEIGKKSVFVIAEVGSNWCVGDNQKENEKRAFEMIELAAKAGADAVKFQTFQPQTLYAPGAGRVSYSNEPMDELFTRLTMPPTLLPKLADHAKQFKIAFMSTPFSVEDFDLVDPYVTHHKIASYEIGHLHLIERAAKSGKPLILSTGAATEEEIAWAVRTFRETGGKDLTLLQCTAAYPSPEESLNLNALPWLHKRFGVPVGLSDHSRNPFYAPIAATALGASVIEKHFTFDNSLPGPDHSFAIEPNELIEMVKAIRSCERMLGECVKHVDTRETELRKFAKRGVQTLCPIKKGELLKENVNIAILRPGEHPQGVHPRHILEIEGKPAKRNLSIGEGILEGDW